MSGLAPTADYPPDRKNWNDLAEWFPVLRSSGVPVPATTIIRTDVQLQSLLDGVTPPGYAEFLGSVEEAVHATGRPCFLRTGHTSGKFDWGRTCYVGKKSFVQNNIVGLIEYSGLADIMGLPTDTWAVRQFMPFVHSVRSAWGMPVAVEVRTFFDDGGFRCGHPYWPKDAVADLNPAPADPNVKDWAVAYEADLKLAGEMATHIVEQTDRVAAQFRAVPGCPKSWSLDWAYGQDGVWYAIDMALADDSWHWPSCPKR